jgi:hypothetical protein
VEIEGKKSNVKPARSTIAIGLPTYPFQFVATDALD